MIYIRRIAHSDLYTKNSTYLYTKNSTYDLYTKNSTYVTYSIDIKLLEIRESQPYLTIHTSSIWFSYGIPYCPFSCVISCVLFFSFCPFSCVISVWFFFFYCPFSCVISLYICCRMYAIRSVFILMWSRNSQKSAVRHHCRNSWKVSRTSSFYTWSIRSSYAIDSNVKCDLYMKISVLQCVAVCCSVLQRVAVCNSVLQCHTW